MKIKQGADIKNLHIKMRKVLISADEIWNREGQELVVTSGLDGTHSAGSLHYYGRAVDLRTNYFNTDTKVKVAKLLQTKLGQEYDVVLTNTHVHVEYDPKNDFL